MTAERSTDNLPRILVIDDELSIRRFLHTVLSSEEFSLHEAENGHAGLAAAAAFRPDWAPFQSPLVEAWALLRTALGARPKAGQGLLIAKTFYEALSGHREVEAPESDLLRRIGRRHILLLKCGAAAAVGEK